MKLGKLLEAVENVSTFSEAYDLTEVIYDTRNYSIGFSPKKDQCVCVVKKVVKTLVGKETKYRYDFMFRESGKDEVEAFKNAALRILKK